VAGGFTFFLFRLFFNILFEVVGGGHILKLE
jgi:hypothetical protein